MNGNSRLINDSISRTDGDSVQDDRPWTVPETARYLGYTDQTLYRLNSEGTGPAYFKIRNRVRYWPRDVRAWICAQSSGDAAWLARLGDIERAKQERAEPRGRPMTDSWDLFADVEAITAWLDTSNEPSEHEDSMRVLKLVEECGEAAEAYIGMVGQNPRKGVTHSKTDLLMELADCAVTALCAMQHFTGDITVTQGMLAAKITEIISRSGIRPGPMPAPARSTDTTGE